MQNQQPMGPGDKIDIRGTTNLLYTLALAHVTCISVFIRRGFGIEAIGINGVVAFIMLLVMWGQDPTGVMKLYFFAWILAMVVQRTISIRNRQKGVIEHSKYGGWPWMAMRFAKREIIAKRVIEPILCVIAGLMVWQLSEVAGAFLMFGAMSMTIVQGMEWATDMMRVQRMRDATIEARRTAAMYRGESLY